MDIAIVKFGPGLEVASGSDTVPLQHFGYLKRVNRGGALEMVGALNQYTADKPWDWSGYTMVNGSGQTLRFDSVGGLIDKLSRNPPAIVHTHTRGRGVTRLASALMDKGTKLIHTLHGMDELFDPSAHELFDRASVITSPSPYAVDKIRNLGGGAYKDKVFVLPNSTDFIRYKCDSFVSKKAHEIRGGFLVDYGKIILITGRLQEDKGIYELGEAVAQLVEQGNNLTMMHAGMVFNKSDEDRLKEIFDRRGLGRRLVLYGKVDPVKNPKELAALYWASDIFVLPSDCTYENFPMSALEALALEKPTAVSDFGGPKTVFVDTGFAIGVTPRSVDSIKNAIEFILSNYEKEKEKACLVSGIIEASYDTQVVVNKLYGIYRGLIRT